MKGIVKEIHKLEASDNEGIELLIKIRNNIQIRTNFTNKMFNIIFKIFKTTRMIFTKNLF